MISLSLSKIDSILILLFYFVLYLYIYENTLFNGTTLEISLVID